MAYRFARQPMVALAECLAQSNATRGCTRQETEQGLHTDNAKLALGDIR